MSCASATSPISSTTGPRAAAATPNAVETVPSMPFAPRLESTRNGVSRAGKNVSTSRIGIEEATTSVASRRQHGAELGGDARLGQARRADASRRSRAPRARSASCQPSSQLVSLRLRGSVFASVVERRARVGADDRRRPRRPGPARRPRGRRRPAAPSRPASQVRSGLEVGRSPTRSTRSGACAPPTPGRAAARRSARSRPGRGGRRTADRRAAAAPARSANAASAAPSRGSRSERPATISTRWRARAARPRRPSSSARRGLAQRPRPRHPRPAAVAPGDDLDVRHAGVAVGHAAARAARS